MIKSGGVIYHNWLLPSSAKGFSHAVTCLSRLLKSQSIWLPLSPNFAWILWACTGWYGFPGIKEGKVKCGYNGFAKGKSSRISFKTRHVIFVDRTYTLNSSCTKNIIHTFDCMLFLSVISTEGWYKNHLCNNEIHHFLPLEKITTLSK